MGKKIQSGVPIQLIIAVTLQNSGITAWKCEGVNVNTKCHNFKGIGALFLPHNFAWLLQSAILHFVECMKILLTMQKNFLNKATE